MQKTEKYQPFATALAFLFLLLLLLGLGGRFWAGGESIKYTGPTHITAGSQSVYFSASRNIFELSHDGELIRIVPPEISRLSDEPIDLKVVAGEALLIAEQRPAQIRVCYVASWECRGLAGSAITQVEAQFKVLHGTDPENLVLTDARGDTLLNWTDQDEGLKNIVPVRTLAGPNGLALDASGSLWVADTDNRRIVELLPMPDGIYSVGREHSAVNELTIGNRYYPMMLTKASDGRWWVAQAAEFSEAYSDLVIYHPDEGVQDVVDLPAGAYATDVVAIDDRVLVTDLEQFSVYQVQVDTLEVRDFGDEVFQQQMQEFRNSRNFYDRLGTLSLIVVIAGAVLMVISAIRATPGNRRWSQIPQKFDWANAPLQVPPVHGVHWLVRNPKLDRNLNLIGHVGFALVILVVVGSLAIFTWVAYQAGSDGGEVMGSKVLEVGFLISLNAMALVVLFSVTQVLVKSMKRKLGTDGKRIYIRFPDGRELAVAPGSVAFTNRLILYRQYTMPLLGGKQQPVYVEGEVESWLAPLLRQSVKLTEIQALRHQWKHRDGALFWPLTVVAILGVILLLIKWLVIS